jgi:uncharacterized protein (DUF1810 family)
MEETGLERFLKEQEEDYPTALEEISKGKKESCWIWYIFPQIQGLGFSEMNKKYSIKDIEEAKAYLENETLKKRLIEITQALLDLKETDIHEVMGMDDCKLKSSMTLFKIVEEQYNIDCGKVFQKTLDKYFKGEDDQRTITILEKQKFEKQMRVKEKSSEEKEENNINKEKENEININDDDIINNNTIVIEKSEDENKKESRNENIKEENNNEIQNENNKEENNIEIQNENNKEENNIESKIENNKEENNIESKIENNKEENNVTNIIINSQDNLIKSEKVEKEEDNKEEKKEIKENNIEKNENVIIEEKESNNSLNIINEPIKEIKIEKDDDSEKEKDKEIKKDDDIINNNINNENDENDDNGDLNSIKEEEKEEDSEEKKEKSGIQIIEENKILTQDEQINTNLINNPSNNNLEPLGKKKSLHFSLPSRSQMKIMENNIKNNDDVEMIISDKKIENKSTIVLYPFEDDEKKKCCPECLIF